MNFVKVLVPDKAWRLKRASLCGMLKPGIRNEEIALSPDRFYPEGMRRAVIEFFAQSRDIDVNGTIQTIVFDAAQRLEQVFPIKNCTG
jgi:hypothetical protein